MATTLPDLHPPHDISPDYLERLEEMARTHGWSLDQALSRALDITEIVLDANEAPNSKVYVYRDGKRYSLQVQE